MDGLTPDEKILQLLNRITFGPRPGDVERVRQMGAARFLDQQLHPERIDDAAVESKVAALTTLSLSAEELAEDFQEMRADRRAQLGAVAGQSAAARQEGGAALPAERPAPEAGAPGPSADRASFLDLLKPSDAARSAASDGPAAGSPPRASAGQGMTAAPVPAT